MAQPLNAMTPEQLEGWIKLIEQLHAKGVTAGDVMEGLRKLTNDPTRSPQGELPLGIEQL